VVDAARLLSVVLIAGALVAGCAVDRSGTVVALTLRTVEDHGDGFHYELFATVNGGAVSLQKFEFRVPAAEEGTAFRKEVVDHFDPERVLGLVDGFDQFSLPIGGVRFRSPVDLRAATGLFVTREQDGDTDPAPEADVIMACTLAAGARGTLSCVLASPAEKGLGQGTATLIPASDGVNPL